MIVSCPECRTLYRPSPGARRTALCGACHSEIVVPSARAYVVHAVATRAGKTARIPAVATVAAGAAVPGPRPRAENWRQEPERSDPPVPSPSPRTRAEEAVDRRLDEIARAAHGPDNGEGRLLRAVLFGVGLGAIVGVAFASELFHSLWLGWAGGGVLGGVSGALWSRAWGPRTH